MFLRCHSRKKNGKLHRYWSVVESRRCRDGRAVQRQVLYLGEINDRQEAAWRKTVEVFDEQKKETQQRSLFPSDRSVPPDEVNALSVVLSEMQLRRPDCRQGVIALIVTPDGLPLSYEVFPGNTVDKTTLRSFLSKIEKLYGKARRVWVMDRGIPTEASLEEMRREGVAYLVGTPRSLLSKLEKQLLDKPWEEVHEGVQVKLMEQEQELYVLARSENRQKKEEAIRRRKLKELIHELNRLKRRTISRDTLLKKLAVLQRDAGRVASFVKIHEPKPHEPVNRKTFMCTFDRVGWKKALERDGCYILRGYLPEDEAPEGLEKHAPALWALVHAARPRGGGLPNPQERS